MKNYSKHIGFLLLTFLVTLASYGQMYDPVTFSAKLVTNGTAEAEIVFTGKIEPRNEVDIKQNYDDDDVGFDNSDLSIGDDVMVESELNDDYSIEEAPEQDDEEPDDSVFSEDLFSDDGFGEE